MPRHLLPVRPARLRPPVLTLALLLALLAGVGALTAAAHPLRRPPERALLSLSPGHFSVSVGPAAPEWLPVSGRPETLTLIAGRPRSRGAAGANAYVGVISAGGHCGATPAASHRPFLTFGAFFSAADSARQVTPFTPDGGGAGGTFLASGSGVRLPAGPAARACIWLGSSPGTAPASTHRHRHHRSPVRAGARLVASPLIPVLNGVFAASVSNLTGAGAGHGGLMMTAISGGHRFTYTTTRLACGSTSTEPPTAVPAGTPASETISLSPSPCTSDATTFRFSVPGLGARTLTYPVTDALANPPVSVVTGGCELDPLTGVTVSAALAYLAADGCRLSGLQVSPFQRPLGRGTVAWAAVDGGVAELAPSGTAVTLVLNGRP
ncbi:hypothetical protein [Conexibacter sp. DBS9H8]|uniref:hypothetical protein n=1 Tax=Conexibacter sp. DBS9H8 TaxID=2937801 RepID=UPI00200CC0E6|nr:hypothetical protein [Conexibacter sp. DBS9H8]